MELILFIFVFVMATFLGFELIQKVPSQLHTPLMSGSNAISGITMVGAIVAIRSTGGELGMWLGFVVEFFKGRRELGMRGEEISQFFVEQTFVNSLR